MGRTCSGSPHSGYVPPVAPSVSTSRSCPRSRFFARGSAAVTFANPPDSTMSSRDLSGPVSYTHLRAHETKANLVCRLLLEKKKKKKQRKTKKITKTKTKTKKIQNKIYK